LIRDGYAKAVLREAVRGIAPDAVLDCRRKVGFNAPLLDMLDTGDSDVREELLGDSPIFEIVRRSEIERWLAKPSFNDSENKFLFNVLSAKMFVEECSG
jgi:asparagine synthase (glutamine-hydrolysing)